MNYDIRRQQMSGLMEQHDYLIQKTVKWWGQVFSGTGIAVCMRLKETS